MSPFDPVLMHAVVTRVEAERPALDLELVVALYHHLGSRRIATSAASRRR